MTGTFPGRIVLVEGDEVDIDLQMGAGKIRLATPFAEIGAWDLDAVEITPRPDGSFELAVDEDVVTFFPNDPSAFEAVIDEPVAVPPTHSMDPTPPEPEEDQPAEPTVQPPEDTVEATEASGSIEDLSAALEALRVESDEEPEGTPEIETRSWPSSRDRLSRAMEAVRGPREPEQPDEDEGATDDEPSERRVSSGFSIPGDPGYVDPLVAMPEPEEVVEGFEDDEDETVADEILEQQQSLRLKTTMSRSIPVRKIGIGVGIVAVIAAIGFATPTVIDILGGDDSESPAATDTTLPETSTTVAPTTTTTQATTTTTQVPAVAEAFDVPSQEFVESWNELAADIDPALRFRALPPSGDFEAGFTQYIAMLGTIGPDGTLDAFTIEVDPAGPSGSDQLGIQALGVAIAVVDPSLEPAQRAELLGVLGLDVRDPSLGGIDGSVTRNGVAYALRYDPEAVRLFLSVEPA